tara:strand:+ start:2883 stop:3209 length:327 start_codon:yes stop_codon:yes gene_type:complete
MTREKLWRNVSGEYNYQFNWIDESGATCGFNDVWAPNKREAVKKAKLRETKAHWALYDGKKYVTVSEEVKGEGHCFRMKGMYVNVKSMYKATSSQADSMNRIGWMLSN